MKLKGSAVELTDLDVERVDAVDRPAIGRSFLIRKNADGGDVSKDELQETLKAQLEKLAGIPLAKDAIASLSVIAKCVPEFKGAFRECAPGETKVQDEKDKEKDTSVVKQDAPAAFKTEDLVAAIAKSQEPLVTMMSSMAEAFKAFTEKMSTQTEKKVEKSLDEKPKSDEIARLEKKPASKQADGKSEQVAKAAAPTLGEGLFTSVIFPKSA